MKLKKLVLITGLALLSVGLVACGGGSDTAGKDKKEIILGVTGGPYNDLFDEAVAPIIEKNGFKIKRVNFSQFMESNTALGEGNIDVNIAQHTAYMEIFNKEKGTDLVPLVATPSVPCSLYSSKYKTKEDLKDGMTIGIPQDPTNAARAYALLGQVGWVKLDDKVKPVELTADAIVENPHKLKIKEIDSSTIPRVLEDFDFEVIPGSVVYDAGITDKVTLISQEKIIKELEIMAAVRKENQDTNWAKAIKEAYESKEFKDYMKKHNTDNYWVMPEN